MRVSGLAAALPCLHCDESNAQVQGQISRGFGFAEQNKSPPASHTTCGGCALRSSDGIIVERQKLHQLSLTRSLRIHLSRMQCTCTCLTRMAFHAHARKSHEGAAQTAVSCGVEDNSPFGQAATGWPVPWRPAASQLHVVLVCILASGVNRDAEPL